MMRILLTRSALHNMLLHSALKEGMSDRDLIVLEAPLLEQVPMINSEENLAVFLQDKEITEAIFISPSSVEFGVKKVLQSMELSRVFAVGKGTANMLKNHMNSFDDLAMQDVSIIYPDKAVGSNALLSLPEMHTLSGKQVLIVTGAEGKPFLEKKLLSRGVKVSRWECYQRQKPVQLTQQLSEVFQQSLDYVFLHSSHAAQHFLTSMPEHVSSTSITAIVGAQAIADELVKSGWEGVICVANSPMPKDMSVAFSAQLQD